VSFAVDEVSLRLLKASGTDRPSLPVDSNAACGLVR